ncbi:MAG: 4Fe-4S dicluster domain-containing protein [Chloroflexi bacterium]|nr:4Fe-4S dicluster domain-containing protein [Chloroflexota bacterium]
MIAEFTERYRRAVNDPDLRPRLLAFQRSWRESRDAQVALLEQRTERSFDELRRDFAEVKDATLDRIDDYIAEFRANAEAAGATVVELTTAEEAVEYIAGVCKARGIDLVVKSKSMVSEEIELNDELAERGITAIETDLGEWLLQLAEQRPSHLVMPAIHQKRQYVAEILGEELGREFDPDDIPAMVASAREGLRRHYLAAGAGLTGANALVAETGSIMVVTNEGNMRLATSLPDVHFVTAGIEKLIPTWADAERQLQLLPRSATAQTLSTYTTCITGAQPGKEMHIILLDNGRREMRLDDTIGAALRCIRCGACANVCPPYQVVGGHTFGHIYTGAIGLVNTAFHHDVEAAAGPQGLCVSCGACETVCPVAIPLPRQILQIRRRSTESGHAPRWERWLLRAWSVPQLFRAAMKLGAVASTLARAMGLVRRDHIRLPLPRRLSWRSIPAIPSQTGSALVDNRPPQPMLASSPAAGSTVDLFSQCLANRLMPATVDASARLIEAGGASVSVPPNQHCCGLPAFDAGDWETARRMARDTIDVLSRADHQIVTPATSCVISMRDHWPQLFGDEPQTLSRANAVADRVHDLAAWLDGPGRLPDGCLEQEESGSWTAHRFCQSSNRGEPGARIDLLVERLTGETSLPLEEAEVCCGFGGLTSIAAPEVGEGIIERKLECIIASGCETLLTNNPGCALHLRAGAVARGASHNTQHYADFLASRLPDDPPS